MGFYDRPRTDISQLANLAQLNSLFTTVPGLDKLSGEEWSEIILFAFQWMVFEHKFLENDEIFPPKNKMSSARKLKEIVKKWADEKRLCNYTFENTLDYFRERYFKSAKSEIHLDHLRLSLSLNSTDISLVKGVLSGNNKSLQNNVLTVLFIVLRYRNNLIHAAKFDYGVHDQLENFREANSVLRRIIM